MNLGLTVNCWSDEDLLFASQFGVTHILAEANMPPDRQWDTHTLSAMRNRVERASFTFSGLASLPQKFSISNYLQLAKHNDPAADELLSALCAFLKEAGSARIPLIVCDCDAPGTGESVLVPQGRGGALIHQYEQTRSIDLDSLAVPWAHLTHWLQRVVPIAEKAGVKLAFGTKYVSAGWLDSVEAMQHILDVVPSPCVGLLFHHAVLAQAFADGMSTVIRHFGAMNKIFLVEFAKLQSKTAYLGEAFLDEPTNAAAPNIAEMLHIFRTYQAAGYVGTVIPASAPGIVGDTDWGHKGQAFNLGYLRSLLQVLERA
jgi:mannonate dehydratase